MSGGLLPESWKKENEFGVRGGVEAAFMSTSLDKAQAAFYARGGADKSKANAPAVLFEIQMGMVDRGADISWLSQVPSHGLERRSFAHTLKDRRSRRPVCDSSPGKPRFSLGLSLASR